MHPVGVAAAALCNRRRSGGSEPQALAAVCLTYHMHVMRVAVALWCQRTLRPKRKVGSPAGLDSASAFFCVGSIRAMAQQGRTVTMSIHQPSAEVRLAAQAVAHVPPSPLGVGRASCCLQKDALVRSCDTPAQVERTCAHPLIHRPPTLLYHMCCMSDDF